MALSKLAAAVCAGLASLGFAAHAQLIVPAVQPVLTSPPVSFDPLTDAAALYATYHVEVTDVQERGFSSATDIDQSLTSLGGHNPDQLTEGWLAYSALIAAQNIEFRDSVLGTESFYGREVLIGGLRNDIRYARTLNGGNAAVSVSLSALEADERRLINAAAFVKEQAYSLQGSSWAMRRVRDSSAKANGLTQSTVTGIPARAALREALASPSIAPVLANAGQSGASSVWDSISSAAAAIRIPDSISDFTPQARIAREKEGIADRIATLAAYRIIGTDTVSVDPMRRAMRERTTSSCVTMANLNLQQCVAAAHKHYEVPFCIGEHALADIGRCFSRLTE